MITDEHLKDIERVFDARVLEEIVAQYRKSGDTPSQGVCEALAHVYGRPAGEIANLFDRARTVG